MLSAYWTETVHNLTEAAFETVDGERRRIIRHKRFYTHKYVPISQISSVEGGDGDLTIVMRDQSEIYGIDGLEFGNMPLSHSAIEDMKKVGDVTKGCYDYYVVYEDICVDEHTAERLAWNEKHVFKPNRKLWNIMSGIKYSYELCPRSESTLEKVRIDIINQIHSVLGNTVQGKIDINVRFSSTLDHPFDIDFDDETFVTIKDIL